YGAGKPIEVRIGRDRAADVAHLEVIDRGPGIDPAMKEKIFEPFQRATTTEPIPGLGLGLYVVKLIVESHGGRIAVDSDLGHGSDSSSIFRARAGLNRCCIKAERANWIKHRPRLCGASPRT